MSDKEKYLKRFQEIYQRKNNQILSGEKALEYFISLITLVESIYQPISKKKYDKQ